MHGSISRTRARASPDTELHTIGSTRSDDSAMNNRLRRYLGYIEARSLSTRSSTLAKGSLHSTVRCA